MVSIEKCLRRFVNSLPQPSAGDFLRYRKTLLRKRGSQNIRKRALLSRPYWLLLPVWLTAAYSRNSKQHKRNNLFLNDVLWGQHCLFLFVRIQDDIFDRHVESSSLIFTSDQFLLEAQKIFSKYFHHSSAFWNFYRKFLKDTTLAIPLVDNFQRSSNSHAKKLLTGYAQINAIFKIGSAAVCLYFGRMKDFSYIEKFADEMAIASQILDDLQDINEDLKRKRFNYVTSIIMKGKAKGRMSRDKISELVVKKLMFTSVGDELLVDVRRRFNHASDYLHIMGIAEAKRVFKAYDKALQQMQISFHRKKVQFIFSKALSRKTISSIEQMT